MAGAGIFNLTQAQDFADKVEKSALPTVVDLWAPWCGPCKMQGKVLEDLAARHAERVNVVKVNVDEVPEIAQRFQVQAIPTLLFFKGGKLTDTHVGLLAIQALEQKLGL